MEKNGLGTFQYDGAQVTVADLGHKKVISPPVRKRNLDALGVDH